MIIEMVMNVIYGVFSLLTSPINIPELTPKVQQIFSTIYNYIYTGVGIVANYTHFSYLGTLFSLIIAVEIGIHLYTFVMFILRKIPFIGIK